MMPSDTQNVYYRAFTQYRPRPAAAHTAGRQHESLLIQPAVKVSGPLERTPITHNLSFGLLLLSLAVVALLKTAFPRQTRMLTLLLNAKAAISYQKNTESPGSAITMLSLVLYIVNVSLFLSEAGAQQRLTIIHGPWDSLPFLLLLVLALTFLQIFAAYLMLLLLGIGTFFEQYIRYRLSESFIGGVFLAFFNFLFIYAFPSTLLMFVMIIVLLILLVIRLVKLILALKEASALPMYQIILYLCTLEILPVAVTIKFIMAV